MSADVDDASRPGSPRHVEVGGRYLAIPQSSTFIPPRVRRRLDYPAHFGLDPESSRETLKNHFRVGYALRKAAFSQRARLIHCQT